MSAGRGSLHTFLYVWFRTLYFVLSERVKKSRKDQGLPEVPTDPAFLARLGRLLYGEIHEISPASYVTATSEAPRDQD